MILTDREIVTAIRTDQIKIEPRPNLEVALTSTAIDLTLSDTFKTWKQKNGMTLRPGAKGYKYTDYLDLQETHKGPYLLQPQHFVLGWTTEKITLPFLSKIAARVEGKSSLARLGVSIHVTAPIIHFGFSGAIQLEMFNFGPYDIELTPGMYVCQLVFEQTVGTPEKGYGGMFSEQSPQTLK